MSILKDTGDALAEAQRELAAERASADAAEQIIRDLLRDGKSIYARNNALAFLEKSRAHLARKENPHD